MMTEPAVLPLEIPTRCHKIAETAYLAYGLTTPKDRLNAAIEAAAPIAVAATIRKILASDECWCHACLRDLADELDPEGAQS